MAHLTRLQRRRSSILAKGFCGFRCKFYDSAINYMVWVQDIRNDDIWYSETCKEERSSEWVADMWGAWGSRGRERKPGHQGGRWWVPGEKIFYTLIRAVCRNLRGPTENSDLLSCDGGFLRSCSDYFTLKMDVIYSSETSADFQWTTWRYIPGDSNIHNDRCENLKSYTVN
jgi:hypothetical protein